MNFSGVRRALLCALTAASLVIACASSASAADCPYADAQQGQATDAQLTQATVCLINDQRAGAGLKPLAPQAAATSAAQGYSQFMAANDWYGHYSPNGADPTARVLAIAPTLAKRDLAVGEDIAWGRGDMATPRGIVAAWMASPDHRANILERDYSGIGMGVADGAPVPDDSAALTYTADFVYMDASTSIPSVTAASHRRKHRRHRRHRRHHRHHRSA